MIGVYYPPNYDPTCNGPYSLHELHEDPPGPALPVSTADISVQTPSSLEVDVRPLHYHELALAQIDASRSTQNRSIGVSAAGALATIGGSAIACSSNVTVSASGVATVVCGFLTLLAGLWGFLKSSAALHPHVE